MASHLKIFHQNLSELRDKAQFLDFTICIDDKELRAHKLVLAACSDYFRAMLAHNSLESYDNRVNLQDISVVAMQAILDFCYECKIDLNIDNVQEILTAASILQINAVQNLCTNFIKERVDISNCLGIATLADRCNLPDLLETALKFCLDRFQAVVFEKEFLEVEESMLLKIISHDELNIDDEVQVFQAVLVWIQADKDNRLSKLETLMEQVRFALIEPIRLVSLTSDELIKNSTKCRDLIDKAKNYLLLKDYPQIPHLFNLESYPTVKPRNSLRRQQRLFAVGGWTDEFKSIASAEMYDPNIDKWIELEPMAQKRCGVGLTTLGDSIYAVGGHDGQNYLSSIERYDVTKRTWYKDVADMTYVRTSVGVTSLDGQIYAIGGQISTGATDKVERYDPKTNTWTGCAPLNRRRLGAGIAVLNGYIYVMGGSELTSIYDSVERYDPVDDHWTYVASMTTARKHLGCTTCNGKIYAVGGRNKFGELDSAECFDPLTGEWKEVTPMHMKRCGIGVVELGGLIYVVGGQNEDARLNVVEAYNPVTKEWVWKRPMNHGRLGGGMTVHPMRNGNKKS